MARMVEATCLEGGETIVRVNSVHGEEGYTVGRCLVRQYHSYCRGPCNLINLSERGEHIETVSDVGDGRFLVWCRRSSVRDNR